MYVVITSNLLNQFQGSIFFQLSVRARTLFTISNSTVLRSLYFNANYVELSGCTYAIASVVQFIKAIFSIPNTLPIISFQISLAVSHPLTNIALSDFASVTPLRKLRVFSLYPTYLRDRWNIPENAYNYPFRPSGQTLSSTRWIPS